MRNFIAIVGVINASNFSVNENLGEDLNRIIIDIMIDVLNLILLYT